MAGGATRRHRRICTQKTSHDAWAEPSALRRARRIVIFSVPCGGGGVPSCLKSPALGCAGRLGTAAVCLGRTTDVSVSI